MIVSRIFYICTVYMHRLRLCRCPVVNVTGRNIMVYVNGPDPRDRCVQVAGSMCDDMWQLIHREFCTRIILPRTLHIYIIKYRI
jgi:hypothetical protein